MEYFEKKENVKYIYTYKRSMEKRFYLLEKKVDIIINKLNNRK
tara:strand:+ start:399 stop:527 length:129 start_codon:yes stop_codon:yes gene_type:complete